MCYFHRVTRRESLRFQFDPSQRGLRKVLGGLEAEIMEQVWRSGSTTVRDVHRAIGGRRDLAYTTVMTVVGRLAEKGLLRREGKDGAAWVYVPTLSKAEFTRAAATDVLRGLMRDFGTSTINQFVELVDSDEQIDELARLVARKKRERR